MGSGSDRGCDREPGITSLMEDHAVLAGLAYRVNRAIDGGDAEGARSLLGELARRFAAHVSREEAGLFAELASAGGAGGELGHLCAEHRRLRALLSRPELADQPARLRVALVELDDHAGTEDDDLFPYALRVLPDGSWQRINAGTAPAAG